jgi:transcriptional regulator with XRE-family HTH domain
MDSYGPRPTEVIAPRLGGLLTEAMKDAGIKARPLALKSGVDKNTICTWCKSDGSKAVKVASVELVARALGKTAEDLLGMSLGRDDESESPPPGWRETIERVDALVKELATLIEATRAKSAKR